jgi:apolipoprotein N-acyltransferase
MATQGATSAAAAAGGHGKGGGKAGANGSNGSSGNKILPSAESIQSIGGLVAVIIGVLAITALAISTMAFIDSGKDANSMIPLATAAFGVISAIVGAYLGIKIGTDQSKGLTHDANEAHAKLAAVQAFVPANQQDDAQQAAKKAAEEAGK